MAVPKPQQLGVGMAVCRKDRAYKDYTSDDLSCIFLSLYSAVFHNFVHIATMKAEEVQAHIRKM